MDWTNETVLRYLKLYQMNPCIWDPKNTSYKNRTRISDAWIDIQNNMGVPCTVKELKKKKECLMSAYRGYRTKVNKSETSGAGTGDVYRPTWYAYQYMDSFLRPIYKCSPSVNTESASDSTPPETSNEHSDVIAWTLAPMKNEDSPPTTPKPKKIPPPRPRITREPSSIREPPAKRSLCDEVLQRVQKKLDDDDEDEFDIIGRNVAIKLRKLSRETKAMTEKLLMEVLLEAELGNINRKTKLIFE